MAGSTWRCWATATEPDHSMYSVSCSMAMTQEPMKIGGAYHYIKGNVVREYPTKYCQTYGTNVATHFSILTFPLTYRPSKMSHAKHAGTRTCLPRFSVAVQHSSNTMGPDTVHLLSEWCPFRAEKSRVMALHGFEWNEPTPTTKVISQQMILKANYI